MMSAVCEDKTGRTDVTAFSSVYNKYKGFLSDNSVIIISGKISEREDREPEILLDGVSPLPEGAMNFTSEGKNIPEGLYLKVKNTECEEMKAVKDILLKNRGSEDVYIYCTETGKKLKAPESLKFSGNENALKELELLLGKECVKKV